MMSNRINPAIIMRVKELGESDLLVSFFTRDHGRQDGIAKGARKSRRRFVNCLQRLCVSSVEYGLSKRGGLNFLRSCELIEGFPKIRNDFSALALASYLIELTEILFPPDVPEPRMFDLLKESLRRLEGKKDLSLIRVVFEARAMALGGYAIHLQRCCDCGREYMGTGRAVFRRERGGIACLKCVREGPLSPGLSPEAVGVLKLFQTADWKGAGLKGFPPDILKEIEGVMRVHMDYRLGQRPKSAKYLN